MLLCSFVYIPVNVSYRRKKIDKSSDYLFYVHKFHYTFMKGKEECVVNEAVYTAPF